MRPAAKDKGNLVFWQARRAARIQEAAKQDVASLAFTNSRAGPEVMGLNFVKFVGGQTMAERDALAKSVQSAEPLCHALAMKRSRIRAVTTAQASTVRTLKA